MRDIKFRAWDSVEKKMFVPDAIMNDGRALISTFAYDKEKFPIMQYSGLKDGKGKEIYEEDLLMCEGKLEMEIKPIWRLGKMIYSQLGRGFDIVIWYKGQWYHYAQMSYIPAKLEVIGNIYENPELLHSEG